MSSRRILEHPILGPLPEASEVTILVDGKPVKAREGETVASALTAAGWVAFRTTLLANRAHDIDSVRSFFPLLKTQAVCHTMLRNA